MLADDDAPAGSKKQAMELLVSLYPEDYPADFVFKGDPGYEDEGYFATQDEIDTYNLNTDDMQRIASYINAIGGSDVEDDKGNLDRMYKGFGKDDTDRYGLKRSKRLNYTDEFDLKPGDIEYARKKIYETDK